MGPVDAVAIRYITPTGARTGPGVALIPTFSQVRDADRPVS